MKGKVGALILFMLVFAASRIPGMLSADLANFSAAYALMFCAGVYLSKTTAWWLPLTAMLLTDIGLNFYYSEVKGWDVWTLSQLSHQAFNYAAYAVMILLGRRFKPQSSFSSLLGGGLLSALLFYFITNTASWLFNPFNNPEYTKTFLGWLTALIKGTGGWPDTWQFFRNTLLSGGLFTALFVGAMKYSSAAESAREKEAPEKTESDPEEEPEPQPEEAKA
ncbi:MAG TPA: hypothetical protein PLH97_12680 [Verrucomicrobiota bacterium]|nr:hypothetical protein [Verrucomicrobiota bacterium]HPU57110.1 hypothetical protein [Verrucomicrobiota bacterium]